jgi:hypothetical protein
MSHWVEIKSFSNKVEAEIAKASLENSGIRAEIKIDDFNGTGTYLGVLSTIRLFVLSKDLDKSKNLLKISKVDEIKSASIGERLLKFFMGKK